MKKLNHKDLDIKLHNIVCADTSEPDYEMYRQILLEMNWDTYVLVEGGHCSCCGFDETEWDAIEYTREELKKLADAPYNKDSKFWKMVRKQLL